MNLQFARPALPTVVLLDRQSALENLSTLRKEWEVSAESESLVRVSGSVGLMLFDVTTKLGLTPEEQVLVLGERLFQEALAESQ
ncbi:MAG: hypothetical protein QY329_08250 [Anaerolineales bacterium]|nr:MAG: hypothetical protein QY329_08250 [Anaerolineales bacterium]